MTNATANAAAEGFAGHPKGLGTLFFTELWERFSYYGMRAILILYMVAPAAEGGLGFDVASAASVYGTYTMSAYLLALPGGYLADRFLGIRFAVLLGGAIIATGHFLMALGSLPLFYGGLACIAAGTGLLKPSISALVGNLYEGLDAKRDAGFAIFFMGINIGAALAPIVCGFLAQGDGFRALLASVGLNPLSSWHWGFGAAGVGMLLGLAQFLPRYRSFGEEQSWRDQARNERNALTENPRPQSLTSEDWRHISAIFILFAFTVVFGVVSEQAGSSLNLFADKLTRSEIFGWEFPSSWFQSLVPIYVIALSPVMSWLWVRLGERQPSSPAKFSLSLLFAGLAYALMAPAALDASDGAVSPLWLASALFLQEIGAVLLNPTGLSVVTKLAPVGLRGAMMGVWFLASAVASKIASLLAGLFDANNTAFLARYFGALALAMALAALVLALVSPFLRRLMGKAR